jgi:superfamily I DNA/RNA helicase
VAKSAESWDTGGVTSDSYSYWLISHPLSVSAALQIAEAVVNGATVDELGTLVAQFGGDVNEMKDKSGRSLLLLSTLKEREDVATWLVKSQGANMDEKDDTGKTPNDHAREMGLDKMVERFKFLRKWRKKNEKRLAAQRRKAQQYSAIIQRGYRCFVARKAVVEKKKLQTVGISLWATVISQVAVFEQHCDRNEAFAKPWVTLKVQLNLVIQNEFDDTDAQVELAQGMDPSNMPLKGALQQPVEQKEEEEEEHDAVRDRTFIQNILLTADALRWVRKQKDQKYRAMFVSRLEQLASGDRSYCMSKHLKGDSKRPDIIETKLDAGQRILWTERGHNILVWYVAKHKSVPHCVNMITRSFDRLASTKGKLVIKANARPDDAQQEQAPEPEVLVEPSANVPLKIHAVHRTLLNQLVNDITWTPPLKLTAKEEEIVSRDGSVLLLGRSGTGKTLCVCNRMARDRQRFGNELKQLFVARTQRLCDYVQALQQNAGEDVQSARFIRMDSLLDELVRTHARDGAEWSDQTRVDYQRFRDTIWTEISSGERAKFDPLVVWTQIRSFIKGSVEAAQQHRPLDAEQYVKGMSKNRCRLDVEAREAAHKLFVRYQGVLDKNGWWDENDRCTAIMGSMLKETTTQSPLYDRVYVDEVQDATQAEVGLLLLVLGGQSDALFLAGDTAQAVTQGVDFRFEEVRSAVHLLSAGKQRVPREERLSRNFRSHEGILNVANFVLDRMHSFFPSAAAKLAPDSGLVTGPRPGLLLVEGYEPVRRIMLANNKLRVLTRDEVVTEVRAKLMDEDGGLGAAVSSSSSVGFQVFGIREAKGLEFSDVLLVDFFANTGRRHGSNTGGSTVADEAHQRTQHKSWKTLLGTGVALEQVAARHHLPLEMELELKLLYVAITRSCNRLFFIETKESPSGQAWFRRLHEEGLAQPLSHCDTAQLFSESRAMTADDWRVEGIETASLVEGCTAETTDVALRHAAECFRNASDTVLLRRAEAHLRAILCERQARAALSHLTLSDPSSLPPCKTCKTAQASLLCSSCKCVSYCSTGCQRSDWVQHKAEEKSAVDAVCSYMKAGLFREAASCCRLLCKQERLTRLADRIERLHCTTGSPGWAGGGAGGGAAETGGAELQHEYTDVD